MFHRIDVCSGLPAYLAIPDAGAWQGGDHYTRCEVNIVATRQFASFRYHDQQGGANYESSIIQAGTINAVPSSARSINGINHYQWAVQLLGSNSAYIGIHDQAYGSNTPPVEVRFVCYGYK